MVILGMRIILLKNFRTYKPNINSYDFYEGTFDEALKNQEPFIIKDMARDGRSMYSVFNFE